MWSNNLLVLSFKLIVIYSNIRNSYASNITNGLVAYWNFDDASTWMNPAYGGEPTSIGSGTPLRSTSTKMFGNGSLYVNGSSHLKINTPGAWLPAGSSAYSISLWFKADSTISASFNPIFWGLTQTYKCVGIHIIGSSGGLNGYWWGDDLHCTSSICPLTVNTWYHVVDTFDGTTHKIYFNGAFKASRTSANKATVRINLSIGCALTSCFNGFIDDIGIYNRALTLTEVKSLYNYAIITSSSSISAASPSSTSLSSSNTLINGLVAYWNFDHPDTWMNPAYGGQTTSIGSGTPLRSTSFKMFGDGSLYLDGSSHLRITSPGEWLPAGSSAYSISLWFRAGSLVTNFVLIFFGSDLNNKAAGLCNLNAQGGMYSYWWSNDLGCDSSTCPLSVNTWYHLVTTFDGTNHKIYFDGVLKASRTAAGKDTTREKFSIGINQPTTDFNGFIDDLGIYNRALTLTEIQTLYGSAIFTGTISSSLVNSLTNGLVAYWNFDDASTWMNPAYGGQPTSLVGTPLRSTSTKMFGDGSLYLDGSSYLSIPTPGEWLPAGSSAYSISLWFRAGSLSPYFNLVFIGSNENNKAVGLCSLNGIHSFWFNNDMTCASATCIFAVNTWNHVVDTFDGTTHKIYLNGVLKASRPAANKATTRINFSIGYQTGVSTTYLNGFIDDLGIYNRAITLTEVKTLYDSSIMPTTSSDMSTQLSYLKAEIFGNKANVSADLVSIKANMYNISDQLESLKSQIKTNTSDTLLEISKIKMSIQKLSATLTKLRKTRERSKKVEL